MKNKVFKFLGVFLIFAILFSGCAKTEKEAVLEDKTASVEIFPQENKEKIKEEIPEEKEVVRVFEKEIEKAPGQTETPKEIEKEEKVPACSLIVRCDDVLKNIDKLKEEKRSIIPPDGIIYANENVCFKEGESVFDILHKELIGNRIHFEFSNTPMYNSAYIEGIDNLYEFDCGSLSGWMYKVNGVKPNFGCSQYLIKENDKIEFYYSCNFMEDNK